MMIWFCSKETLRVMYGNKSNNTLLYWLGSILMGSAWFESVIVADKSVVCKFEVKIDLAIHVQMLVSWFIAVFEWKVYNLLCCGQREFGDTGMWKEARLGQTLVSKNVLSTFQSTSEQKILMVSSNLIMKFILKKKLKSVCRFQGSPKPWHVQLPCFHL